MPPPPSILVLGLGELGEQVVQHLATHPLRGATKISVLLRSRKPATLTRLRAWNAEYLQGDVHLDSEEHLATLFAPYHTLITCTGMTLPPSTQPKLARAALAAGVQRYFPWQYGIDYDIVGRGSAQDLFDSQVQVREMLRAQERMRWVVLSTGMFVSFLFERGFGVVRREENGEGGEKGGWRVEGIGGWENEITVTTPSDIAAILASIVLAHPHVAGVVYSSGDTISMARLADVVERVTGSKVHRVLKTVPELKEELAGDPGDAMKKYRVVFAEGRGVAWRKEDSWNVQHSMETMGVEEWARGEWDWKRKGLEGE